MARPTEPEQEVTQAGIWADDTLRSDIWAAGAVFLVVLFLVGIVLDPGDEVERAQNGAVHIGFGMFAALIVAGAAIVPGRRMPDWAIGLRESAEPLPPVRAPLVSLGWVLTALAALGGLIAGGIGAAIGAAAIASVAPFALARSLRRFLERANRTRDWAAERKLDWHPEGEVPHTTPLLRDGTYQYALNVIEGELADGVRGRLFHLATVEITGSHDDQSESTSRSTALVTSVPDPGKRLPLCVCAPRSRIPGTAAYEAWRRKLTRIDLVSSEFERRFELAIDREGDEIWLRRLFEPTFLERMIKLTEGRLGWELEGGDLTVYQQGYVSSPAELERLVDLAAIVAERVRVEVAETV